MCVIGTLNTNEDFCVICATDNLSKLPSDILQLRGSGRHRKYSILPFLVAKILDLKKSDLVKGYE